MNLLLSQNIFKFYILSLIHSVTQFIVENKKPFNAIRFETRFFFLSCFCCVIMTKSMLKLFKHFIECIASVFLFLVNSVYNNKFLTLNNVKHSNTLVRMNKCHSQVCIKILHYKCVMKMVVITLEANKLIFSC